MEGLPLLTGENNCACDKLCSMTSLNGHVLSGCLDWLVTARNLTLLQKARYRVERNIWMKKVVDGWRSTCRAADLCEM